MLFLDQHVSCHGEGYTVHTTYLGAGGVLRDVWYRRNGFECSIVANCPDSGGTVPTI